MQMITGALEDQKHQMPGARVTDLRLSDVGVGVGNLT